MPDQDQVLSVDPATPPPPAAAPPAPAAGMPVQTDPTAVIPPPPPPPVPAAPAQAEPASSAGAAINAGVPASVATPPPAPPAPPAPAAQAPPPLAPPPAAPPGPVGVEAPTQSPVEMPATVAPPVETALAVLPPEWPYPGYDGPQPWQVSNPPELTHDRGFVTSGTTGEIVIELAAILAHLGYQTEISRGGNPHAIYDTNEAAGVAAFCRDYGVQEDPAIVAATTPSVVGPWLWEALFRALYKKRNEQPAGAAS